MTATQAMNATKGQTATHLHYIGEESGEVAEIKTIRNRSTLGKTLKGLEDVGGTFKVYQTTISVY